MSEERDIVERLKALDGDDHTRLECPARYAECTCGYTHRMEAIIPEAASEIQRLRGEVERLKRVVAFLAPEPFSNATGPAPTTLTFRGS